MVDHVTTSSEPKSRKGAVAALLPAVILAIVLNLGWAWLIYSHHGWARQHDLSHIGAFGDAFAPIASLVSTLALVAALATVWMQRVELREAREHGLEMQRQADQQRKVLSHQTQVARVSAEVELLRLGMSCFGPDWATKREGVRHALSGPPERGHDLTEVDRALGETGKRSRDFAVQLVMLERNLAAAAGLDRHAQG